MRRMKTTIAMLAAAALSGCMSTRGGQDVGCAGFDDFAKPMAPGSVIQSIERNPGLPGAILTQATPSTVSTDATAVKAIDDLFAPPLTGPVGPLGLVAEPRGNILLLSGGGQWGAYGAGLFLGLACPRDIVTDRHGGALPCHDAAGKIVPDAVDFAKLDALHIRTITGVSTGGLQASLLMIVLDAGRAKDIRTAALGQLVKSYLPARESDLVDNTGFVRAVFKGSVAGTNPLRRHLTEVFDTDRLGNPKTSFIAELYRGVDTARVDALIGFVDASDGQFKRVDVNEMLREIRQERAGEDPSIARASRCLLAASLASAAMPVFHQQMRVVNSETGRSADDPAPNTLFDGGVRRSVFAEYVGAKAAQAVNLAPALDAFVSASDKLIQQQGVVIGLEAQLAELLARRDTPGTKLAAPEQRALGARIEEASAQVEAAKAALASAVQEELAARKRLMALRARAAALPGLYVLRNGPTTREKDPAVDAVKSAEPQALRAYDLMVNALEVGSIAALRLQNPLGPIHLSTAEGIAAAGPVNFGPRCPKRNAMMFDPTFMRCLLLTGVQRAQRDGGPWWPLPLGENASVPAAGSAD